VHVKFDLLFADVAFSPSAHVIGSATIASTSYIFVKFVDVTTVWVLFVIVADGFDVQTASLQLIIEWLGAKWT